MTIQLKDKGATVSAKGASYELSDDTLTGFAQAVRNGQTRLALEYMLVIVSRHDALIAELMEAKLASEPENPSAEVESAPEVPKKTTRAKQTPQKESE